MIVGVLPNGLINGVTGLGTLPNGLTNAGYLTLWNNKGGRGGGVAGAPGTIGWIVISIKSWIDGCRLWNSCKSFLNNPSGSKFICHI